MKYSHPPFDFVVAALAAKYFKRSRVAISLFLQVCGNMAILQFTLLANNLFLSHNNKNVRGNVIKAFLIVSYSME